MSKDLIKEKYCALREVLCEKVILPDGIYNLASHFGFSEFQIAVIFLRDEKIQMSTFMDICEKDQDLGPRNIEKLKPLLRENFEDYVLLKIRIDSFVRTRNRLMPQKIEKEEKHSGDKWACSMCTLENEAEIKVCNACGNKRNSQKRKTPPKTKIIDEMFPPGSLPVSISKEIDKKINTIFRDNESEKDSFMDSTIKIVLEELDKERDLEAELNDKYHSMIFDRIEKTDKRTKRVKKALKEETKRARINESSLIDNVEQIEKYSGIINKLVDTNISMLARLGALEKANSEKSESSMCCVCWEEDKRVLFMPCKHFCVCKKCSEKTKTCPLCRKDIEDYIVAFVS